ncbi:MAG: Hsp20/alpha crystallin family protein [Desulfocapsaceae bacterium]|nr:Hsp20/alpha crystallin family protein [Desulfocapsaceae bacterium]
MDIKKWIPWNWFQKEEEGSGKTAPVQHEGRQEQADTLTNPLQQFHQDIDRLFDQTFRGFGLSSAIFNPSFPSGLPHAAIILKPTLDLAVTDHEYTLTVEIPGVDEQDVKLEIVNDTLTIRGEKKQEKEEKEKNYYRMERSYGSFQRILCLPDDADQDNVKASFAKGILTVTLPRKTAPKSDVKHIEIKNG